MGQQPTDRNYWENELTDDDLFWINLRGLPVLTDKEQRLFNRLEDWHRAFFQSLMLHTRLKSSLEKIVGGDKKAENLSMQSAFIREYQLRPIMSIRNISILIFPLIDYDNERTLLENSIIDAIESWGLIADGLSWKDISGNLAASEEEQWSDLIRNYSKEGSEKRRQDFISARVNINDLEALATTGALHWRVVKYLRVWRYFLQDVNKLAKTPSLIKVNSTKEPDFESLHHGNTKPIIKTREKLKVLWECHDDNLSVDEILQKCKKSRPDLFSKYTRDTFSKGRGNPWKLAQDYGLIPARKTKNPT